MIGGISGIGAVSGYNAMANFWSAKIQQPQKGQDAAPVYAGHKTQGLEQPVQPVEQVKPVSTNASGNVEFSIPVRHGADPAEMAVRMRMRYVGEEELMRQGEAPLDAAKVNGEQKSPQEIMEEAECQTCEGRKYQDESDDSGVSFQAPGHIAPEVSGSVVRGHEMEHVLRERAQAQQEDREVVRQSVVLHNSICPECGRVYVSGGTTSTTTAAVQEYQTSQNMDKSGEEPMTAALGFDCVA